MKIITILGSPKRNGNTSKALDMVEENFISQGHSVERIHVIDFKINGCVACNACIKEKDKPNCVQKDDAMSIFNLMMSADVLIYAFPLYAFSFPAQIKSLIDRHYCFATGAGLSNQSSVIEGKRVVLLVTCSDPIENNADLIQINFDRIFINKLKCNVVGKHIIASSSAPDFNNRAKEISTIISNEIIK
jgi:putative NADPH-quinone reductase